MLDLAIKDAAPPVTYTAHANNFLNLNIK
jgi:hypothetical protein